MFATNNLSTDFFAAEKVLAEWLDDNGRCLVGNFGSDSAPYEGFGACLPRNFRVRVPQAASYRVSIQSFDWIDKNAPGS